MAQTLFLYEKSVDDAWLERRQGDGVFRAAAHSIAGDYAALGLIKYAGEVSAQKVLLARSSRVSTDSSANAFPFDPPPLQVLLAQLTGQVAHVPADRFIGFFLLQISNGNVRTVAQAIADAADERVAVAFAFGAPDFNVVVEIVDENQQDLLLRALELTDRPEVLSVRSFHTTGDRTRGFGEPGEVAEATPPS